MGLFNALFKGKSKSIKEYRFIEIAKDTVAPHIAKNFKEMLDSTRVFGWNPDDFSWHTFDDPSSGSEKSSVSFNAKFVKKDESNNMIFLDTGQTETGQNMFFFFTITPSEDKLYLSVKADNNYTLFTALILLE